MNRLLLVITALLAALAPMSARALDPTRSIAQFYHRSFGRDDGLPGAVEAIAQTSDGFLWVGASSGLYRFDGVRFERIGARELLSLNITALCVTRDGDLWVGYLKGGVSRMRGGAIVNFPAESGGPRGKVGGLREAPNGGGLWANADNIPMRFDGQRWIAISGEWDSRFEHGGGLWATAPAPDGTVWGKNGQHTYYCRPGCKRFVEAQNYAGGVTGFARDGAGRIWTSDTRAPGRMYALPPIDGISGDRVPNSDYGAQLPDKIRGKIFLDRDGTLWNMSRDRGIRRVRSITDPVASTQIDDDFMMRDGLSADKATIFFEDREGVVWVGTNLGLDMFRPANVVFEKRIPLIASYGYLPARTKDALYFFASTSTDATSPLTADAGPIYRVDADGEIVLVVPEVKGAEALMTLDDGDVRVGTMQGLFRIAGDRLIPEELPPQIPQNSGVCCALDDHEQKRWVGVMGHGVWRHDGNQWLRVPMRPDSPDFSPTMLELGDDGAIWAASREDGLLVRFFEGRAELFRPNEGPKVGPIGLIQPDGHGVLFGGEFGLARHDRDGFHTLRTERIPELSFVSGIVEAEDQTWIQTQSGIVRFATEDLERALADPGMLPAFDLFNREDGMPGDTQQDTDINTARLGPDGRLWFITNRGVVWIDPHHIYRNTEPPPVAIRSVTVGGNTHAWPADLNLAAGTSTLQIDYAALSFVEPSRVQFRYKLDGVDNDWVDPGMRRQAFYTKLGPGDYRFNVIASNNDGVWNRTGATLAFSISPTFEQSNFFLFLCAIGAAFLLWVLYKLRLRQVSQRIRERLEERVAERERIARDLHDTLLQSVQGLILRFDVTLHNVRDGDPLRTDIQETLQGASRALQEGRDKVRGLRGVLDSNTNLEAALAQLASEMKSSTDAAIRISTTGESLALTPTACDEIYRIGAEALINACRHARAEAIDIEIKYLARELCLHIRDNGRGIPAYVLDAGARSGHWGLPGMRERAARLHATLALKSDEGAGADIELRVPAFVAYERSADSAVRQLLARLKRRAVTR